MAEEAVEKIVDTGIDKDTGFIESLARYYSDFLSTDFKKGRLPKRKFQVKDPKGRVCQLIL